MIAIYRISKDLHECLLNKLVISYKRGMFAFKEIEQSLKKTFKAFPVHLRMNHFVSV